MNDAPKKRLDSGSTTPTKPLPGTLRYVTCPNCITRTPEKTDTSVIKAGKVLKTVPMMNILPWIFLICVSIASGMRIPISSRNLATKQRRSAASLMISGTLSLLAFQTPVHAVPLGEHTTCAYPSCQSQADILKNDAPQLVSEAERQIYVDTLKDIQYIFTKSYPLLLEKQDYLSMRQALRSQPSNALRLTARKYKVLLPKEKQATFSKVYSKMIDLVDDVDVLTFKRMQGASTDEAVRKAMDSMIQAYEEMMTIV